eukprot:TRINITY_DN6588_c0_g1_i1.p1 TRINITY_DN6588_c0_g1~~TRINITY_DN6588_c0_g1_i1.p1  ORF type:complete len:673 (-),score=133.75 TRINITY_DN6588_c0_g1_i1:127-2145(-)
MAEAASEVEEQPAIPGPSVAPGGGADVGGQFLDRYVWNEECQLYYDCYTELYYDHKVDLFYQPSSKEWFRWDKEKKVYEHAQDPNGPPSTSTTATTALLATPCITVAPAVSSAAQAALEVAAAKAPPRQPSFSKSVWSDPAHYSSTHVSEQTRRHDRPSYLFPGPYQLVGESYEDGSGGTNGEQLPCLLLLRSMEDIGKISPNARYRAITSIAFFPERQFSRHVISSRVKRFRKRKRWDEQTAEQPVVLDGVGEVHFAKKKFFWSAHRDAAVTDSLWRVLEEGSHTAHLLPKEFRDRQKPTDPEKHQDYLLSDNYQQQQSKYIAEEDCIGMTLLLPMDCDDEAVIGRERTACHMYLRGDDDISKCHIRVAFTPEESGDGTVVTQQRAPSFFPYAGTYSVTDLATINGTYLNETRLSARKKKSPPVPIFEDDSIRLGEFSFVVRTGGQRRAHAVLDDKPHVVYEVPPVPVWEPIEEEEEEVIEQGDDTNGGVAAETSTNGDINSDNNDGSDMNATGENEGRHERNGGDDDPFHELHIRAKKARWLTKEEKQHQRELKSKYRDRAQERRIRVHGKGGGIVAAIAAAPPPDARGMAHREPISAPERKVDAESVGGKMLQKMGWKDGTGLGKDGGGTVAPVSALQQHRVGRAGLGSETPTPSFDAFLADVTRRVKR